MKLTLEDLYRVLELSGFERTMQQVAELGSIENMYKSHDWSKFPQKLKHEWFIPDSQYDDCIGVYDEELTPEKLLEEMLSFCFYHSRNFFQQKDFYSRDELISDCQRLLS